MWHHFLKKSLVKLGIFLLLNLLPVLVFAADDFAGRLDLTPPASDLSMGYLAQIFGVVDGVLSGSSQLLGSMFGVFNSAVLALGAILATYVTLVSTLNTAQEGEVLGRKWSSLWIPFRLVIGIALLLPKATGYSLIQILVMYVVVQGVGAADSIWQSMLTYLLRGGVIVQQAIQPNATVATNVVNTSGGLMKSLVCMNGLERLLIQQRTAKLQANQPDDGPVPSMIGSLSDLTTISADANGVNTVPIPNLNDPSIPTFYQSFTGACGTLTWKNVSTNGPNSQSASIQGGGSNQMLQDALNQVALSRTVAVQQMVNQLNSSATTIVNNYFTNPRLPLGTLQYSGPSQMPTWVAPSGSNLPPLMTGSELQDAAASYYALVRPALIAVSNLAQVIANDALYSGLAKPGWVVAGQYFFQLIQANTQTNDLSSDTPPTVAEPGSSLEPPPNPQIPDNPKLENLSGANRSTLQGIVNGSYGLQAYINSAKTFPATGSYQTISSNSFDLTQWKIAGGVVGGLLTLFPPVTSVGISILIITGGLDQLQNLANSQATNVNPIVALAQFGYYLLNAAVVAWLLGGLWTAIASSVMSIGACVNPIPYAILAFLTWFVPLFSFFILIEFVAGLGLSVFLPLIPMLIFTFGVIGWLIGVIESMIAAPIVALALASPEGHEALGKSVNGFMLLLGVFLRPSLMLFGFAAGIILSWVGVWFFTQGFFYMMQSYYTPKLGSFALGILPALVAILCLYVSVVIFIVNKSFSLTHRIPDQILRWLGGQYESLGADMSGGVEQVQRGFEGRTGEVGGRMAGQVGSDSGSIQRRGEQSMMKDREAKSGGGSGPPPGGKGGPEMQVQNKEGKTPTNQSTSTEGTGVKTDTIHTGKGRNEK